MERRLNICKPSECKDYLIGREITTVLKITVDDAILELCDSCDFLRLTDRLLFLASRGLDVHSAVLKIAVNHATRDIVCKIYFQVGFIEFPIPSIVGGWIFPGARMLKASESFWAVKPFLDHLDLKMEKCIRLKLLV